MANRKVPAHEEAIFLKYTPSQNTRRLSRDEALSLWQREYMVRRDHAEVMFDHFDADKNGQLSLWEFHHFCTVVGNSIVDVTQTFAKYDKNNSGAIKVQEACEGLEALTAEEDVQLTEKEWDFLLKTAALEGDSVHLGQFIDLFARLRQHKKSKKNKTK